MESMKKAQDSLESFIKLADFLKEVQDYVKKNKDLPQQVATLEAQNKAASKEVEELVKKRSELKAEIQKERETQLANIDSLQKSANSKSALLDEERAKVKNERDVIVVKEAVLERSIADYNAAKSDFEAKSKVLDEKMKRVSEAVA